MITHAISLSNSKNLAGDSCPIIDRSKQLRGSRWL